MEINLTCSHAKAGLCPECRRDFEEDPLAYLEFGSHPAGEERWREVLEDLALDARWAPAEEGPPDWDPEIPF